MNDMEIRMKCLELAIELKRVHPFDHRPLVEVAEELGRYVWNGATGDHVKAAA
jgi:hypothetical protein